MAPSWDTPDYRRAVVSPQALLASVASPGGSATVTLPPNTQTLVVACQGGTGTITATATGAVTGLPYPGSQLKQGTGTGANVAFHFNVAHAVDNQITVAVSGAPNWWVYADHARHVVAQLRPQPVTDILAVGVHGTSTAPQPNVGKLTIIDLATGAVTDVALDAEGASNDFNSGSVQWSPDGSKFAFNSVDLTTGFGNVRVCNRDGTGLTTILQSTNTPPGGPWDSWAVWDWWPDGSALLISYADQWTGVGKIMKCAPDGSSLTALYTDTAGTLIGSGYLAYTAISPDASTIAVVCLNRSLRTLPAAGGGLTLIYTDTFYPPSPSGAPIGWRPAAKVVFVTGGPSGNQVKTINGDGTGFAVIGHGSYYSAIWASTSELLIVVSGSPENLLLMALDGTTTVVPGGVDFWGGVKMSV